MKKGILFGAFCAAVLSVSTFVACNSTEEPILDNPKDVVMIPSSEFEGLLSQIVDLNNSYKVQYSKSGNDVPNNNPNRSARDSANIVQLADDMGSLAGGAAAFGASGAVSIPGSPAAGAAVAVLLGAAMSEAGAQLFSAAASACIGYQIVTPKKESDDCSGVRYDTNMKLEMNTLIEMDKIDGADMDILQSVGKRHNLFMVKSQNKYGKYSKKELKSEKVIGLILEDCIVDLKDAYREYGELEYSDTFKSHLISVAMDMLQILDDSNTQDGFSKKMQNLLINKYGYDKEKVMSSVKFEKLIFDGCNEIDSEKIGSYSAELSKTINQSGLTTIEKANLLTGAQVAVNSRLCWSD